LEKRYPEALQQFYAVVWKYALEVQGIDEDTPQSELRIRRSNRTMDHSGLSRKDGYPIFKAEAPGESPKLPVKKDLVRIFLNQNYGKFSVLGLYLPF